ncbi:hypothetical protein EJ02DRAFT_497951 [Clathrospora elynae]|uniref:Uncharacterized protein n=1 Tax=Clathrospora elynae TaxID=706981 RepID=A0A6A5SG69_9PLEO|nr:hypothetical protein EJ02DRAFT_497951 [Clathrospora elynae]
MPKRIKYDTPPRELVPEASDCPPQLETPQRSAIHAVFYFCQQQSLKCNLQAIHTVFGIPKSTASKVVASGQCRRLQNHPTVPNTCRGLRELTASDANAIASYIQEAPFVEKADPWQDLAERAGVVKEYKHEARASNVQFHPHMIQERVTEVTGMKTHKAVVKEKHTKAQISMRLEYIDDQLELWPKKEDWRCVLWCDELHWITGPRWPKNIKRDAGEAAKYAKDNIQYEEQHKPDPQLQHHFHMYCVLGYDFAFAIPYNAGNSNGKMNTKTYINTILPALQSYILEHGKPGV